MWTMETRWEIVIPQSPVQEKDNYWFDWNLGQFVTFPHTRMGIEQYNLSFSDAEFVTQLTKLYFEEAMQL